MALREPLGEPLGREPAAVVLDHEAESAARIAQAHGHAVGIGVLNDVGEQLARGREQELVAAVRPGRGQVEP